MTAYAPLLGTTSRAVLSKSPPHRCVGRSASADALLGGDYRFTFSADWARRRVAPVRFRYGCGTTRLE